MSPKAREEIDSRLSQELVVAMVGPISSGVSTTARLVRERLVEQFGYAAAPIIKISKIIDEDAYRVDRSPSSSLIVPQRIEHLQETGRR
jgi:hypothetical protein